MKPYSLQDAREHLEKLIDKAQRGETVIITDENNHAVQLIPMEQHAMPRKAGSARGLVKIAPDFDAPLSDFDRYTVQRFW